MPIYEYICEADGCEFEHLTQGSQTPTCPQCGGTQLRKKFSTFAAKSTGSEPVPASGGCCPCGQLPGSCGLN